MKNSICVEIRFSFKGENFAPKSVIDLDPYLEKGQAIPPFFQLVAHDNQIDAYSYQYEVMELGQTVFSKATGLAAEFCEQGQFDMEGFSERWREHKLRVELEKIARETMGIEALDQSSEIYSALLAAYRLGQKS